MITKDKMEKPQIKLSGRTEPRFFPKAVRFTQADHTVMAFQPGLNNVPSEYADDPWLKANGVTAPQKGQPLPPLMRKAPLGSQAAAAALGGSGVYDATFAPRQHSEIDPVAEADQAEGEARAAENHAEMLHDRAKALRGVADKWLATQANVDRSHGIEANTGEGAEGGEDSGMSDDETTVDQDDDDDGQDGSEAARPVEGDINPKTKKPYTPAALEKAQVKYDEKHGSDDSE